MEFRRAARSRFPSEELSHTTSLPHRDTHRFGGCLVMERLPLIHSTLCVVRRAIRSQFSHSFSLRSVGTSWLASPFNKHLLPKSPSLGRITARRRSGIDLLQTPTTARTTTTTGNTHPSKSAHRDRDPFTNFSELIVNLPKKRNRRIFLAKNKAPRRLLAEARLATQSGVGGGARF